MPARTPGRRLLVRLAPYSDVARPGECGCGLAGWGSVDCGARVACAVWPVPGLCGVTGIVISCMEYAWSIQGTAYMQGTIETMFVDKVKKRFTLRYYVS